MKKYKVNYKDRNYIVSADNHISAVNKVRKAYQDAKIKDFDEKPLLDKLFKIAAEGERLNNLQSKIFSAIKGTNVRDIFKDPRVAQWIKQVRKLRSEWNKFAEILINKFQLGPTDYWFDPNEPDGKIWKGFKSGAPDGSVARDMKYAISRIRERKGQRDAAIKDGDLGRGIAFTFKVSTNSVIDAFKANKIELAGRNANSVPSDTSLDKLVSDIIKQNAVHLEIPGNTYSSLKLEPTIDFHTGQSTIQYLGFDTGFTMKKYGGAEAFDKAKLTAEMNKYLERLKRNISAAGIKINQAKIEVGGSSEFYNYWRQAQSYNDTAIKDFDEKPYLNELSKLAVEAQRLMMLRHKIVEFYKNYPANKDNWLNDAKVIQWVKQARQLRDKWNRIGKILVDKFDLGSMYLFKPDESDKEVWFTQLPESEHVKYFKNIIKAEREHKGQRDAAIKDSKTSDVAKEIKKAYPQVKMQFKSIPGRDAKITLTNYPEPATKFHQFMKYTLDKIVGKGNYDYSSIGSYISIDIYRD